MINYSNRSVVVRYPCRFCGCNRPEKVEKTPQGGYTVSVGVCCPHRRGLVDISGASIITATED